MLHPSAERWIDDFYFHLRFFLLHFLVRYSFIAFYYVAQNNGTNKIGVKER